MPFWDSAIVPALDKGKTVLVAAHGNSIRGMATFDDISDDDITGLEIPRACRCSTRSTSLRPILDPRAAGLLTGAFLGTRETRRAGAVAAQTKVAA